MKVLDSSEIRDLDQQEMQAEILAIKRILFDFRLKQATRQTIKPHSLKAYKKQLARITTIKHEKYSISK
uniref:Large ribosomal subunit protein uL29c n=1 Tax=Acrochaetium secundatum TaxID=209631 RepID=A0A4D6BN88_9FLOR|nr:ribosomal protein L29 [Acrochaetium secundatum]QBX88413.1 ribosomal protein L29 [Acrochaetium secundatum]